MHEMETCWMGVGWGRKHIREKKEAKHAFATEEDIR